MNQTYFANSKAKGKHMLTETTKNMMLTVYGWLGVLLRTFIFEPNAGNDDWKELVHPETFGLTQTQNLYITVHSSSDKTSKIAT